MRRPVPVLCLSMALIAVPASTAGAQTISPTSADFGSVEVGKTSAPKAFVITAGLVQLETDPRTNGNDFFHKSGCGGTLQPGQSCTAYVTFTATAPGRRTGELIAGFGGPRATLTGTGKAKKKKRCKNKRTGKVVKRKKCKKSERVVRKS
jgi:hypothetical protein